jgi:hypothetical protein
MKTAHIVFQLAAASVIVPGQIDHECRTFCTMLAVQDGAVKFIDQTPPGSSLNVGDYVSADQPLIPLTEAPIRDLHSRRGWRVVVSASLDHDELVVRLRLRFFSPGGELAQEGELLSALVSAQIGAPFGGKRTTKPC